METKFRRVILLPEFEGDLKKLKRFRTLDDDLRNFIDTGLYAYHKLKQDFRGIFEITGLALKPERVKVFKAKKFTCRSLKGKGVMSGIRVIYSYNEKEDRIELIQLYYKDREDTECDWARINAYCEGETQGATGPS